MPTYEYACTSCGERLEVVQRFSDEPLTECPACRGALRKVFSPVGVVFKGSGFYKTDSRGSSKSSTSSPSGKDASSGAAESTPTSTSTTSDDGSSTGSSSTSSSSTESSGAPAKDSKSSGGSGERVA